MSIDVARATHAADGEDQDDIATYIDTLDPDERVELAAASVAIDLGILLYRSQKSSDSADSAP